jgi:putative sigma-54 modulation protein
MTLTIEIYGRNLEVTDRINDYVTKKASKLDRYLNGIEQARVDLAYVKSARSADDRHVAQITVHGKGFILRSEESADDLLAAFDTAMDKIQRRMERYKGKHYRGRADRRTAADVLPIETEPVEPEEEESEGPVIARRKRFAMTPMDEMEAIEQMILLGHDNFFIFHNVNTNMINVLYRRKDGTYGLIEPITQ